MAYCVAVQSQRVLMISPTLCPWESLTQWYTLVISIFVCFRRSLSGTLLKPLVLCMIVPSMRTADHIHRKSRPDVSNLDYKTNNFKQTAHMFIRILLFKMFLFVCVYKDDHVL